MDLTDKILLEKIRTLALHGQAKVLQGVLLSDPEVKDLPRLSSKTISDFFYHIQVALELEAMNVKEN